MRTLQIDRFRERHLNDDTRYLYRSLSRFLGEEAARKVTLRLVEDLSGMSLHVKSFDMVLRAQRLELAREMLSDGHLEREVARTTHLPVHTVRRLARGDFDS